MLLNDRLRAEVGPTPNLQVHRQETSPTTAGHYQGEHCYWPDAGVCCRGVGQSASALKFYGCGCCKSERMSEPNFAAKSTFWCLDTAMVKVDM